MSFNKFMHPRNPYKVPPDFKEVASQYPQFRKHVYQDLSGKLKFNFKDSNALQVFTKTLLHRDFGLNVDIPPSRLVPTLPLRLNYILWIEDLLKMNQMQLPVYGIDLGTGASCIYPLLGHKRNAWHMLALDTDDLSCSCAQKNVNQNEMNDFIKVKNTSSSPEHLGPYLDPDVTYAFTMCNPPFYASSDDMMTGSKKKKGAMTSTPRQTLTAMIKDKSGRPPPTNGHTGSEAELVAPGGEVAFAKTFIEANININQIKIFTTMLGHKTSFNAIKSFLSQHPRVKTISTTEFCQGKTMRWGIAWTTSEEIQLRDELPRKSNTTAKKGKPLVCVVEAGCVGDVLSRVASLCDALRIIYKVLKMSPQSYKLNLTAHENTWSQQRRLKRLELKKDNLANLEVDDLSTSDNLYVNPLNTGDCKSTGNNEKVKQDGKAVDEKSVGIKGDLEQCENSRLKSEEMSTSLGDENCRLNSESCEDSNIRTHSFESTDTSEPPIKKLCIDDKSKRDMSNTFHSKTNQEIFECASNPSKSQKSSCISSSDPCQFDGGFKNSEDEHLNTCSPLHQNNSINGKQENQNTSESLQVLDTKIEKPLKKVASDKGIGTSSNEESRDELGFKAPLVICNLLIEKLDIDNQIAIEMIWVSGTGSRDLPHQIMQYLKNNL